MKTGEKHYIDMGLSTDTCNIYAKSLTEPEF